MDLARQDLDVYVLEKLGLHVNRLDMTDWKAMLGRLIHPGGGTVEIGVVGKYIGLRDAYKSIYEALTHAGIANDVAVRFRMVESEEIEARGAEALLSGVHGVLVPGGFGNRGIEGKIQAIRWARESGVPFFGICLGMQCAVMEFARHVCGMDGANSTEFQENTPHPVIDLMSSQAGISRKGGTMRLGQYMCHLNPGTRAAAVYQTGSVRERHRHRYEFNNAYRTVMEQNGMVFSGLCRDPDLVEIIELPAAAWYVACQFHPEFQSSPLKPHPLFRGFVQAAKSRAGSPAAPSEAG